MNFWYYMVLIINGIYNDITATFKAEYYKKLINIWIIVILLHKLLALRFIIT